MNGAAYDEIGVNYPDFRRADPRIEARIWAALGDARSVVNVGAGTGSYEPRDRETIAVEPSSLMIARRPAGTAPVLQGVAEALPLEDQSVDAAMGVFTIHHWDDLDAGLAEMRRVARKRIVLATIDAEINARIWTLAEYFPEAMALEKEVMPSMASLEASLPGATIEAVPMPSRCRDEFTSALWDRPELFLEPATLRASSLWHRLAPEAIERGQERLRADLESGRWDEVHGHLRTLPELDIGLRLVRAEL
ncbi:MAG TPA: methyltransferase domain-containing protein [Solirubrobacterales bacterium]|jgi:SAM-dependent methyltransferase|nr:methyltransferase domain-containing protein [Solirubrobacterales bacterium]